MVKVHQKVLVIKGEGSPIVARKTGRNDSCSCGSGRKAKKCCGNKTKYYSPKK